MRGPHILVQSLTEPYTTDKFGNAWQYHSRSDRHSRVACWGILFDLLDHCPLLRQHVEDSKVGFGINHEMHDFKTGRKKDLDLVICTPGSGKAKGSKKDATLTAIATKHNIVLTSEDQEKLELFPDLVRVPVGSVHLALEAKATMTAHIKALPRLHDELNSSHAAIHGASDFSIAAGFTMVNLADEFVSSDMNKFDLKKYPVQMSSHQQPKASLRTIEKIREIPRRAKGGEAGFDAVGIVVIKCRNDLSPVELVEADPAPPVNDIFHYDSMIRRIAHLYENKFANI